MLLTNINPYLKARPRRLQTFNQITGLCIPHAKHLTKKKTMDKSMVHNIIYPAQLDLLQPFNYIGQTFTLNSDNDN